MSRPVKLEQVDLANVHEVHAGRIPHRSGIAARHQEIHVLRPIGGVITREQALADVAWLILVAELSLEQVGWVVTKIAEKEGVEEDDGC